MREKKKCCEKIEWNGNGCRMDSLLILTEAFTLICSPIDEYFGADYVTEGEEHLH